MNLQKMEIAGLRIATVPAEGKPRGAAILCHGFGAPGDDLVSLASQFRSAEPALKDMMFLFPAAPITLDLDPDFESRAWWEIDIEKIQQLAESGDARDLQHEHPPELPGCRETINKVIQHVHAQYDIDHRNIVVGGFSQGSMLATDVALRHEPALGGLIVWSGTLLCESDWRPLAGKNRLPVFQSHGTLDPILPFENAVALCNLLSESGLKVVFTEFDGPHTIPLGAVEGTVRLLQRAMG